MPGPGNNPPTPSSASRASFKVNGVQKYQAPGTVDSDYEGKYYSTQATAPSYPEFRAAHPPPTTDNTSGSTNNSSAGR